MSDIVTIQINLAIVVGLYVLTLVIGTLYLYQIFQVNQALHIALTGKTVQLQKQEDLFLIQEQILENSFKKRQHVNPKRIESEEKKGDYDTEESKIQVEDYLNHI